jgi:hypothetical protein
VREFIPAFLCRGAAFEVAQQIVGLGFLWNRQPKSHPVFFGNSWAAWCPFPPAASRRQVDERLAGEPRCRDEINRSGFPKLGATIVGEYHAHLNLVVETSFVDKGAVSG